MRILLATTTMDVGGIERSVVALARALHARGHDTLVLSSGGYLVRELERDGTPHVAAPLDLTSPAGIFRSARLLRQLVHDQRLDLIHSFSATASVVTNLALRPFPSNGFSQVHVVSSPMGLQNSPRERPTTTWLRNLFLTLGAEHILVISPEIRRHLKQVGARDEFLVDFNFVGLDVDAFQPQIGDRDSVIEEFGLAPGARIISTIGALHPRKSHELFIDAAVEVLRGEPDAYFLVVGGGELRRDLERYARRRGVADRVVFTGVRDDIPRLLSATDVYVKPGVVEGFIGITVLEAMALSKPVVAFDTEDVKLAIADGVTGLVVPNGDTAALADRILFLLRDAASAERLGAAGRQLVVERFRFGLLAERLEQFYQQIIAGKKPTIATSA